VTDSELEQRTPPEHRFLGLDRRYIAPLVLVVFMWLLWAVVAPAVNEAISRDEAPTTRRSRHQTASSRSRGWRRDAVIAVGPLGIVVSWVIGITGLVFAFRFANRRQRTWMGALLADEVASGTITKDELAVLEGPRKAKKQYLESIRKDKGKQAARNAGFVLEAQTDLAATIAATDDPSDPEANAARAEVARLRALPA
jgi:hypothetical protein